MLIEKENHPKVFAWRWNLLVIVLERNELQYKTVFSDVKWFTFAYKICNLNINLHILCRKIYVVTRKKLGDIKRFDVINKQCVLAAFQLDWALAVRATLVVDIYFFIDLCLLYLPPYPLTLTWSWSCFFFMKELINLFALIYFSFTVIFTLITRTIVL